MSIKNNLTINEIIELINLRDFSFMDSDITIKPDPQNKENLKELIKVLGESIPSKEDNLSIYFPFFIDNDILKFNNDKNKNIKIILEHLLSNSYVEGLIYFFHNKEYKHFFNFLKENIIYVENIIRDSITQNDNELFHYFYNEQILVRLDTQYLINLCISSNNKDIFKFLIKKENFNFIKYSIINTCLKKNSNSFFIRYLFDYNKDYSSVFSKSDIYSYLHSSTTNFEVFSFLFNKIKNEINNFRLCDLIEKSIENSNSEVIELLLSCINFNISNYDYDFLSTFFHTYIHHIQRRILFYGEAQNVLNKEQRIEIFSLLINNKYIIDLNSETNIEILINFILKKFDFDLLKFMFEYMNIKYKATNSISKIRLQESFFIGANQENSELLTVENFSYAIDKLSLDLYYRNNIYIYKIILKKASNNKDFTNNFFSASEKESNIKVFINYLLDNQEISNNFDINILKNYSENMNPNILKYLINKLKFKNF